MQQQKKEVNSHISQSGPLSFDFSDLPQSLWSLHLTQEAEKMAVLLLFFSFPLPAQKIMKPCCFTYLESILHGEPLRVINRVMVWLWLQVVTYYNYAK